MNPAMIKFLAGALGVILLIFWAGWERNGKLQAQKQVTVLEGRLELCAERTREQNRGITALGNATIAANARAEELRRRRAATNAPLVASIARLEDQLKKSAEGKTCTDALNEWRNGK